MPPPPVAVVIEEQAELGHVLKGVLAGEGYEVVTVRSADDAIAAVRERSAVLLVSNLPSPSGPDEDQLGPILHEFPGLKLVEVRDEAAEPVPFFGPWRRNGGRITLRRPFRLDDLLDAVREFGPR